MIEYTLKGHVAGIDAELLDVSTSMKFEQVPGNRYFTLAWRGGKTRFAFNAGGPDPKLGDPVTVTIQVGAE